MSHSYPSDISREQFARILPTLESVLWRVVITSPLPLQRRRIAGGSH